MSTRSNVIVKGGQFRITLYRHYDGYPAEAGACLLESLSKCGLTGDLSRRQPDNCAASLVNRLLRLHTNEEGCGARFDYEVTTEIHGDIEHLYVVRFTNGGWVEIDHAEISITNRPDDDAALLASAKHYRVAEFAAFVNEEREQINRRIAYRGLPGKLDPIAL